VDKKANGDLQSFVYSIVFFILIIGGILSLSFLIFDDNNVTPPVGLSLLDNKTNTNSEIYLQLEYIQGSLPENDSSSYTGTDFFENNMFVKAYKTVNTIRKLPKYTYTVSKQMMDILGIPSWFQIPALILIALFVILGAVWFFRGMTR